MKKPDPNVLKRLRLSTALRVLPIVFAFVMAGGVLMITHQHGIGMWAADSVSYARSAEKLLKEGALRVPLTRWDEERQDDAPLSRFPPLLPCLLALLGYISNLEPMETARWLNAACLLVLLLMLISFAPRSPLYLLTLLAIVISPAIYPVHLVLLSEPLFLVLCAGIFLTTQRMFDSPLNIRLLLASALLCGLATLTRYAGLFTMPCAVALLLLHPISLRAKLMRVIIFTFSYAIIVMPWFLWLKTLQQPPRTLGFLPGNFWDAMKWQFAETVTLWIFPGWLPLKLRAFLSGLLLLWLLSRLRQYVAAVTWAKATSLLAPLIWMTGYAAFIVIARFVADDGIAFDHRILSPLALYLLLLVGSFLQATMLKPTHLLPAAALLLSIGIHNAYSTAPYIIDSVTHGFGYADETWKSSTTLAWLKTLPPETTFFSNAPEAIATLLPINVKWIPLREEEARLEEFGRQLERHAPAALVLFTVEFPSFPYRAKPDWHKYLLLYGQIIKGLHLQHPRVFPDALVFTWGV